MHSLVYKWTLCVQLCVLVVVFVRTIHTKNIQAILAAYKALDFHVLLHNFYTRFSSGKIRQIPLLFDHFSTLSTGPITSPYYMKKIYLLI